jgi:Zn-dependent peptidase ImmA (M78 family)/transcriptional regulator with XRE-family HTH domain
MKTKKLVERRVLLRSKALSKYVPGFVGEKLVEARQARGLTQIGLADLIGVTNSQVSKYEKEDQAPSPEAFEKIYTVLNIPSGYFLKERKRAVDKTSSFFYRSMQSKTKTQRLRAQSKFIWLQDIYAFSWKYVNFPKANIPKIDLPNNIDKISFDLIEEVAEYLRNYWSLSDSPISNISRVIENNGIILGSYNLDCDEIEAFSQMSFDKPHIIFGNGRRSSVGTRFSVAHELGHLILHQNLPNGYLENKVVFKKIENQAHHFARAFLFPRVSFRREVVRADIDVFRILKGRWKMAISAMIFRALDLGLMDDDDAKKMRVSISRRGWRTSEPLDDVIPYELPELLKDALTLILDKGIKSRSQILNELLLSRNDIEELACLQEGFLDNNLVQLTPRVKQKIYFQSNKSDLESKVLSFDSVRK